MVPDVLFVRLVILAVYEGFCSSLKVVVGVVNNSAISDVAGSQFANNAKSFVGAREFADRQGSNRLPCIDA